MDEQQLETFQPDSAIISDLANRLLTCIGECASENADIHTAEAVLALMGTIGFIIGQGRSEAVRESHIANVMKDLPGILNRAQQMAAHGQTGAQVH